MAQKMLQVIPKTLTFTPSGGTAVTLTEFADAVAFTYEVTYADIASQSSDYAIGKLLTGRKASLKAVANKFDLAQMAAFATGDPTTYTAGTDTLVDKARNFDINEGAVEFVGYDTAAGKEVTITITRAVAMVSGDMSFGKDSEVKLGVQFDALAPDTGNAWEIAYSA